MSPDIHDAIVLGGGPAGAAAAIAMRRAGLSPVVLERAAFPRFHIGESLLPGMMRILRELGIAERIAAVPQVEKLGATFVNGDGGDHLSFLFADALAVRRGADSAAFNVERAPFDAALLDAARDAGADVRRADVRAIARLADGDVAVEVDEGGERSTLRGRYLVDASGQSAVVGRHLGIRRVHPDLQKVAYLGQFEDAVRDPGPPGGFPVIAMCREGWFWLIPLDERRTSIGLVIDAGVARRLGVPAEGMLDWGIARSPFVAARTENAVALPTQGVIADFSYRCEPFAGPGYFLAGDAATFVDPIFSTGVCLGMASGVAAGKAVARLLRGEARPAAERRRYIRLVRRTTAPFFRLVRLYYDPAFRDLFLEGKGPLGVHRAVISILAAHGFPRLGFDLRWRMGVFEALIAMQRVFPLAPRKRIFSLLDAPAAGAGDPLPSPRAPEHAGV